MAKSFSANYSKWDKIELSDDESDLHPNIDKDSWFRLKHRTRIEREEKEDAEIKMYTKENAENQSRLNIIKARMNGLKSGSIAVADDDDDDAAEFEDIDALIGEADELERLVAQRNKRIEEINERRKWNIDNICQTKEEKTIVNEMITTSLRADDFKPTGETEKTFPDLADKAGTSTSSSAAAATTTADTPPPVPSAAGSTNKSGTTSSISKSTTDTKTATTSTLKSGPEEMPVSGTTSMTGSASRERFAVISYNDFVLKHEMILEEYSEIRDMEQTKEYLFKHCDVLLHEHGQSYMLLSCLEDEMNGKRTRMKHICRQSQILSHVTELATSMKRDPRDMCLPFFKRISEAEYMKGFTTAVAEFTDRIIKRAVEKRKEMDAEDANDNDGDDDNVPLGPGGLNPYKVGFP